MTAQDILSQCTVESTIVKLPAIQLDRKLYLEVAKSLELIGGKWKGGKVQGFVFPTDPTELLNQVAGGQKRNLKKEFQFFETPKDLADQLVQLANIQPTDKVLEPSAGRGAIINAIHNVNPNIVVDYCELMDINLTFMKKLPNVNQVGEDFLALNAVGVYDKIIANPPFSKNQDIEHITKMWKCLKPGGRIVTFASTHWQTSSNNKEITFRNWLDVVDATVIDMPKGLFEESGTSIPTTIIIVDKCQ